MPKALGRYQRHTILVFKAKRKIVKHITLIILLFFSVSTIACKCMPSDIDKWFSESVEVAYIRVVGTSLEVVSKKHKERVRIQYQIIEKFKDIDKESKSGFAYEDLHNCALGIKTGAKYIFYIREHRIISRCGGSQLIYGWTDKGKQILENLRAQALNKSKHPDEAASGV